MLLYPRFPQLSVGKRGPKENYYRTLDSYHRRGIVRGTGKIEIKGYAHIFFEDRVLLD